MVVMPPAEIYAIFQRRIATVFKRPQMVGVTPIDSLCKGSLKGHPAFGAEAALPLDGSPLSSSRKIP